MKTERLIGILSVLLRQEKTTAPELARRFEVSRRTISRDIETLCRAGIPICTVQGAGGGISIMDGYRVDRTLLTSRDMQMILAGLRSLDSVSGSNYYRQLMEKLNPGSSDFVSGRDYILIDLSSWYGKGLAEKISLIREAVEEKRILSFRYCAPGGESIRRIEPYFLVFHWSSWYVWGWCEKRGDFRLFKAVRMADLKKVEGFEPRNVPLPDLSNERAFPGKITVTALFAPEMKWRLAEEYGPDCWEVQEDGRLLFCRNYTSERELTGWLLTFGDGVEVLEPESVRESLFRTGKRLVEMYGNETIWEESSWQ